MRVNLKSIINNKLTVTLYFLFLSLQSGTCHSKAWTQEKGKTFAAQKVILNMPFKSSMYDNLTPNDKLLLASTTQESSLENYLEYGLLNNLTLTANLSASLIREKIKIEVDYANTHHKRELNLSYNKLKFEVGTVSDISKTPGERISFTSSISPGEYIISKFGNYHLYHKQNLGIGLAYGKNFYLNESFKHNYYEVSAASKYYPKLKNVETDFTVKFGYKPNDKWTILLGSYNTFNTQNKNFKPYLAAARTSIEGLQLLKKYEDFYKNKIKTFLSSDESSNVNKLQLGVACLVSKNKEIQLDLFVDPFHGRHSNNSSIIISLNERF